MRLSLTFTFAFAFAFAFAGCGRDAPVVEPRYLIDRQTGFGVAFAEARGDLVRTRRGKWLPAARLEPAKPVHALAALPERGRVAVGWVIDARAPLYAQADEREPPIGWKARFDRVEPLATAGGFVRVHGGYLRASQLRVLVPAPRPPEVGPAERWVDVDTATETLAVYEGDAPIFATLVSTGTGRPGWRYSTPRGLFHVEWKVPSATMDNVDEGGDPPYSFEEVPWVQYFHKEVALHGAYWHQRFGHPASHGCVNLTSASAERLYALTRATTPAYPGTLVRVR